MRFGLCCKFLKAPIAFRTTTVTYIKKISKVKGAGLNHLSSIILHNAKSLSDAIAFCFAHKIGAFRISSQFFPVFTHDEVGYSLQDLPEHRTIMHELKRAKNLAQEKEIRLTMHPDQFVVLSSPNKDVIRRSIKELEYHGLIADLTGADVINIHGGGAYGDKMLALKRFMQNFKQLSKTVKQKLTIENDDKLYTPDDLLPICELLKIPFVYDVHHHRCNPDGFSIEEATRRALKTWHKEPLFHLSSPKEGWKGKNPRFHHDYIDPKDFPSCWKRINPLTIDIEAKAKELAIFKLQKDQF